MSIVETDSAEPAQAEEARLKPKVGRIPVNLRLNDEGEEEQDAAVWAGSTRKGDTQFMFFLVALFVVVNVTLVFLLNYKGKTPAAAPVEMTKPAIAPVAPVAVEKVEKNEELPPPPPPVATELANPTAPVAAAPSSAPTVPVAKSYVTPVTAETNKASAAPYHPVSVSEHQNVQETAPVVASTPQLKVIQSQNLNPSALPALAPAAGSTKDLPQPAKTTPATTNATQDLLSVISQD